jgi:hypothetical protein
MMGDMFSPSLWIALTGLAAACERLGHQDELRSVGDRLWRAWTEYGEIDALRAYLNSAARDFSDPEVRHVAEQMWAVLLRQGDVVQGGLLTTALARYDREHDAELALDRLDVYLAAFEAERSAVVVCIEAELEAATVEARFLGRRDAALARLTTAVQRVEDRLDRIDQSHDRDWVLNLARPLYLRLLDLMLDDPDSTAEALWLHEASLPATLTTAAELSGRVASAEDAARVLAAEPGVAVVSFAETESTVGAFVLRAPGQVTWVPLDVTTDQLGKAAMEISVAFNGAAGGLARRRPLAVRNLDQVDLSRAERVLAALGEVLPITDGAEVVCVIPSAGMDGLPLHAMRAPSGRLLVEVAGVVHQASLTAFVASAAAPPPKRAVRTVFVAGVADSETDTRALRGGCQGVRPQRRRHHRGHRRTGHT